MVLGLGSYANYVDQIKVTVPGGKDEKREHIIEQVVPDAQVIVIPHPMDEPRYWMTKLFYTPSDIVFQTLYTLLGICVTLLVIIFGLHKREQIEDKKEQREFRGNYLNW